MGNKNQEPINIEALTKQRKSSIGNSPLNLPVITTSNEGPSVAPVAAAGKKSVGTSHLHHMVNIHVEAITEEDEESELALQQKAATAAHHVMPVSSANNSSNPMAAPEGGEAKPAATTKKRVSLNTNSPTGSSVKLPIPSIFIKEGSTEELSGPAPSAPKSVDPQHQAPTINTARRPSINTGLMQPGSKAGSKATPMSRNKSERELFFGEPTTQLNEGEVLELTADEIYSQESRALAPSHGSTNGDLLGVNMSGGGRRKSIVEGGLNLNNARRPSAVNLMSEGRRASIAPSSPVDSEKRRSSVLPGLMVNETEIGPGSYTIPDFLAISRRRSTVVAPLLPDQELRTGERIKEVKKGKSLIVDGQIYILKESWMFTSRQERRFPPEPPALNEELGPGKYFHLEDWPINTSQKGQMNYSHIFKSKLERFSQEYRALSKLAEAPGPASYDPSRDIQVRAPDQSPWVHRIQAKLGRSRQDYVERAKDFVRPTNAIVNEVIKANSLSSANPNANNAGPNEKGNPDSTKRDENSKDSSQKKAGSSAGRRSSVFNRNESLRESFAYETIPIRPAAVNANNGSNTSIQDGSQQGSKANLHNARHKYSAAFFLKA